MILELAAVLTLAQRCAPTIAPETMLSVVQVESRFNPLAINVNGAADPAPARTASEAIRTAEALIRQGRSVDLGLAQINSKNLAWLGMTVADAFDPCRNLAGAARVLEAGYVSAARSAPQQQALRMAFSAYNTGDHGRGFTNGYVAKVEAAAGQVVPAIGGTFAPPAPTPAEVARQIAAENLGPDLAPAEPPPPAWDVFARTKESPKLVFRR
ncbi:lytic transglycosylase domain-containing protein [Phenylobacterium sp.]|jgi:type IV secretion system protein VirB1|uniref:lytic transglycosylase domain-containing protein n=1 Tax=Phenylobacterium sp. TaxID=1871053 RepID=UPI000C92AC6E|nr:lytic transglycosylase domain-containing protein [Phenylobacterium sp.]MAK81855.1 conjugal transfer protein [Phenylobacterium sp.]MCA6240024.1 lytic transglycosylase domain-containing protein [Phenylobacterium sp.]|tara:strand:- start:43637 stop:44272 length:636 start_codon:yes stop_codon:yes gene_type:complete